jgi:hypothetical protein
MADNQGNQPKKPLDEFVKDWLTCHGCKLEYLTCNAFNAAALRQEWAFYLWLSHVLREIDVLATRRGEKGTHVHALCECKYSADHPWVLLLPRSRGLRSAQLDAASRRTVNHRDAKEIWHFANRDFFHSLLQARSFSAAACILSTSPM